MSITYKPFVWTEVEENREKENKTLDIIDEKVTSNYSYKVGVSTSASGSAYIECGQTKVVCSVYGPKPSTNINFNEEGILTTRVKFSPFAIENRPKFLHKPLPTELLLSHSLKESLLTSIQLHKFPKHEVLVCIEILETDGKELAASILCASLALTDADIDMYDMVTATTVGFISKHEPVIDPKEVHFSHPKFRGLITLAYLPNLQQITYIQQTGYIKSDDMNKCLSVAYDSCQDRLNEMKGVILRSIIDADIDDEQNEMSEE